MGLIDEGGVRLKLQCSSRDTTVSMDEQRSMGWGKGRWLEVCGYAAIDAISALSFVRIVAWRASICS